MSQRFLPPLEADTNYRVADFEYFEIGHGTFLRVVGGGETSILRLHLKDRTTLDLPVSNDLLQHLLAVLIHAFPDAAQAEIKRMPLSKRQLP